MKYHMQGNKYRLWRNRFSNYQLQENIEMTFWDKKKKTDNVIYYA